MRFVKATINDGSLIAKKSKKKQNVHLFGRQNHLTNPERLSLGILMIVRMSCQQEIQ